MAIAEINASDAIRVSAAAASSQTKMAAKKIAEARAIRPRNTARSVRRSPGVCNFGRVAGSIVVLRSGGRCKLQVVANSVNHGRSI